MKIQIQNWTMVILMCLFLYTPCVWSAVDLGDLSYHVSDDDFGIQRTYNSRRVREGLFGFGWCSVLETELKFGPDGQPTILTCDGRAENTQPLPRIGSEWIWNSGPGRFPIYKFGGDGKLRFLGTKLNRGYQILWKNHSVELRDSESADYGEIVFHFAKNKDLTSTVAKIVATPVRLFEKFSKLTGFAESLSRTFVYQDGLLIRINAPAGHSVFTYNSERNLSELSGPGRIQRKILYDRNKDEIKEVKREDGCFEFYERPKSAEAATARLICSGQVLVKEVRG